MSNQVDNRVVSMEFDNSRFEKNVHTSMSTLDKLKQKLHLKGAAKGIEEVDKASKKIDMSTMSKGVETVHAKFSALEIMGITALSNITNKAVDAGARIVKALTLDPVMDGFQEYEMTLNAVQTTMAGTGKTAEEVEKELKKLDVYADKTVYSTADMLNNLPKFTNAGVELEKATQAMIGIANATAHAGGDAGKASIAFYNLGQAIGTGYLSRMDYNSINNAGIATMEWKKQMVDAAIAAGTLKKKGKDLYEAGGKSFTLQQLFIDGLQKQWATTDVMMKVFGDYGDETTKIGKAAYASAQDIKSFTMMMDSLKATAGTGWKDTWQIIFGGLEEAKKFWTPIANYIGDLLGKMSDFRNTILGIGLGFKNVWDGIAEKLDKAGLGKIKSAIDGIKGGLKDLKYWQDIVTKVWRGDYNNYGDNPDRFEWLEKDGYNHKVVQDLVNKGYKYKLTMADVEASHKKFGLTMDKSAESTKKTTKTITSLTDEQLKNAGLTAYEISLYRALQKEADRLGISFDELVEKMSKQDGRSLLIDSFKNIWKSIEGIFKAMKQAFVDIFNPPGVGELGIKLYGLIARFNEFSKKLALTDSKTGKLNDNGKKLVRTFKGIFAIVDIVATLVGGPLRIAFKIISKILSAFGFNILDVTAVVGDALVAFHDWIDSVLDFGAIFEWMLPYLKQAKDAIVEWYNATKPFAKVGDWFKGAFDGIKAWFEDLKTVDNIPKYIFEGLVNGFKAGIKAVGNVIATVANYIIDVFCNIFGIHSPSVVFFALGGFIIAGLLLGIKHFAPDVWKTLEGVFGNIIDFVKQIDFGGIITAIIGLGLVKGFNTMASALEGAVDMFSGFGEMMNAVGIGLKKTLKGFGSFLKGKAWEARGKGIMYFAIGVGILAASVYALAQLDYGKLWSAVGAIAVLAIILGGLMLVLDKFNSMGTMDISKNGVKIQKTLNQLLPIAAAMLLVAIAVKKLGEMSFGDFLQGTIAMVILSGVMVTIMAIGKRIGPDTEKLGGSLMKMAIAIGILALVARMIGGMDPEALVKGILFMGVFVIIVGLLTVITKHAGWGFDKLGGTLIKMSLAIAILALVARMIGGMDPTKLAVGMYFIGEMVKIVLKLTLLAMLAGARTMGKLGSTMLGMASAMAIMALVVQIVGGMDPAALVKGLLVINFFTSMIIKLVAAVFLFGGQTAKIGATILAFAVAMGIMGAVVALLGMMKVRSLAKGLIAMSVLGLIMQGLVKSTKDARNCHKNIMMMAVVIGVMALAIGLLSFIDPKNLGTATAAIAAVTGVFALLLNSMKNLKSVKGAQKDAFITLIMLTGIIAILAGIIVALSFIPGNNVLDTALGLSALMLALSGTLIAVSYAGKFAKDAQKGILYLSLMVIPLALFAAALAFMPAFPAGLVSQLPILGAVIGAMTLLLFPLALVGMIGIGKVMTGILALTAMVVPLCALVAALTFMPEFPAWVGEQLKMLLPALTVMSLLMPVLALAGLGGPAALIGIGSLAVLIIAIGGLATLCGALGDGFKNLLEKGLPMLVMIAGGIGEMIGAFIGGIADGVLSHLPNIGQYLSDFANNAKDFISIMKTVDGSIIKGVSIMVAAILELSVAQVINTITTILSFGNTFGMLGNQLSMFMRNSKDFIDGAKSITPDVANGIKCLGDAILNLTAGNLMQTITDWITGGDSSLETFGAQLGGLGNNLRTFVTNLGVFDGRTVTTVGCACDAIKKLAEAAEALPGQGGWVEKIVGGNSLAQFGAQLGDLGTNLSTFIVNLTAKGKFDDATTKTVKCAGEAIKSLASAASELPNDGGWLASLLGDNSLATFGDKLPKLGTDISSFVNNLTANGTFNNDTVKTVECAGSAIKALADAANTIPNEGGFWSSIVGDNSLATFGDKLPGLATNLKDYVTNLGAFGPDAIEAAYVAVDVVTSIASMAQAGDVGGLADGIDDLNDVLGDFGSGMKNFVDNLTHGLKGTTVDAAVAACNKIVECVKAAAAIDSDAFENFVDSIESVGEDAISKFVKAFTGDDPVDKVKKGAKKLLDAIVTGFKDNQKVVNDGATKVASTAAGKVATTGKGGTVPAFEQAGKDLGSGLVKGIEAKETAVYNAAYKLGQKAVQGEKDGQASNSPSKLTIKAGKWLGEGLIVGMHNMMKAVYSAGHDLGEGATGTISSAISRISDVVNSDIDAQPTIRPVLDLSDVSAGAGTISRMLSMNPSVGVLAKAGSINAMMNERQNGNGDVVSAIKDLKKTIGNKSGDTYQFGNVTYGDDSAVSDAVGALVRAIRVEGRA